MPAPSRRVDRSLGEEPAGPWRLHEPEQPAEPVVAPRDGCRVCERGDAARFLHDIAGPRAE
jgi:hypothetical protein